jgi:hypothetical protein
MGPVEPLLGSVQPPDLVDLGTQRYTRILEQGESVEPLNHV